MTPIHNLDAPSSRNIGVDLLKDSIDHPARVRQNICVGVGKKAFWGWGLFLCFASVVILGALLVKLFQTSPEPSRGISKSQVAAALGPAIWQREFPEETLINIPTPESKLAETRAKVQYSLDLKAQRLMTDVFARYRPDYGAFVAMDATTGRILNLVSYQKDPKDKDYGNLAVRAIFPAASVFKVVTATAAIDQAYLEPESIISFNGSSHTLYKKNLSETPSNRWTRHMTFKEAFAKSINTIFGKIGVFQVGPKSLLDYAERFNFDKEIAADIPVEAGLAFRPDEDNHFEIAEVASGFNRASRMSPLQGAMIAAAVANEGVMMEPYLVNHLYESESGKMIYSSEVRPASITMKPESAAKVRELMQETISAGTSRKSFRTVFRGSKMETHEIEFGGKTGSLTGDEPKGKVDWFVGYARSGADKIAIAALTINKEYWTVKSSYLGAYFFDHYFEQELTIAAKSNGYQERRAPSSSRRKRRAHK